MRVQRFAAEDKTHLWPSLPSSSSLSLSSSLGCDDDYSLVTFSISIFCWFERCFPRRPADNNSRRYHQSGLEIGREADKHTSKAFQNRLQPGTSDSFIRASGCWKIAKKRIENIPDGVFAKDPQMTTKHGGTRANFCRCHQFAIEERLDIPPTCMYADLDRIGGCRWSFLSFCLRWTWNVFENSSNKNSSSRFFQPLWNVSFMTNIHKQIIIPKR